jgi:sulfur carrier protein
MERTSSRDGASTLTPCLSPALRAGGLDPSGFRAVRCQQPGVPHVLITLNGERFELDQPMTVSALLTKLDIDSRRVAIEHNLEIIKRRTFDTVVVKGGDRVEIVNAVGGG